MDDQIRESMVINIFYIIGATMSENYDETTYWEIIDRQRGILNKKEQLEA